MTHLGSTSSSAACWPWFISCIYTPFSLNFVDAFIQGLFTLCLLTGFFLFSLYSKPNTLVMFVFLKEIPLIWTLLFTDSQFISICLVSRGLRSSFIVQTFWFLQHSLCTHLRTVLWLQGQTLLTLTSLSFFFIFILPYINDDFAYLQSSLTTFKPCKHSFLCILIACITYNMLVCFLSCTHLFAIYAEYCVRHGYMVTEDTV